MLQINRDLSNITYYKFISKIVYRFEILYQILTYVCWDFLPAFGVYYLLFMYEALKHFLFTSLYAFIIHRYIIFTNNSY